MTEEELQRTRLQLVLDVADVEHMRVAASRARHAAERLFP